MWPPSHTAVLLPMVTMSLGPNGHPFIARDKNGEVWTRRHDESKICLAVTVETKVSGQLTRQWGRVLCRFVTHLNLTSLFSKIR